LKNCSAIFKKGVKYSG